MQNTCKHSVNVYTKAIETDGDDMTTLNWLEIE